MPWMQYQGFKGLTRQEYRKKLLGDSTMEEGLQLAIINKNSASLIGDIYLRKETDIFWIGYTINPSNARQGYAYEAVNGIITWIRTMGSYKISAAVLPENTPSINLLEKLGFDFVGMNNEGERTYTLNLDRTK